jgi:hypothetical protein
LLATALMVGCGGGGSSHDYGTAYGTSHQRGDLQGIIDSLGMNAIRLTPVFHPIPKPGQGEWEDRIDTSGYFISDYFAIDPNFGILDQARELVDSAHAPALFSAFASPLHYPLAQGLVIEERDYGGLGVSYLDNGLDNQQAIHGCAGPGPCVDHVSRTSALAEEVATRLGEEPTVLKLRQFDLITNYGGCVT